MKKIISIVFICILFCAQSAFADICDNLKQYTLHNGQTVIIKEVKDNPIVIIDTYIKTGSSNENDLNNGVAHFLEHLFFKGTTNRKRGEFEKILESKGGVFNAATSRDFTHYYVKIDNKYLDEALNLHADMLLNISIPQKELDMERKVVLEEITRSFDNPSSRVFDNLMKIVFNGTTYQRKILGTNEIISNVSRNDIMAFHDTFYKPSNMVTVIVGDVDTTKTLNKVANAFSVPSKKNHPFVRKESPKVSHITGRTIIEHDKVDTGYLMLGYPTIGNNNLKEAYALNIAASLFADGQNSILYKTMKEDENVIIDAGAGNYELKNQGLFYIMATFEPKNYNIVSSKVKNELKIFINTPIDAKRLQLLKNSLKRQYEYSNENITNIADNLGYSVAVGNGVKDYCNYLEIINSITPEFINETMKKYLKDETLATSVLLPEKMPQQIAEKKSIVNISNLQSQKAKLVSNYKNIKKYRLPNGLTLLLQKNDNNNVIATKIFIKGGSLSEEKAGTADILSETILQGTINKTGKELENALDNIGTNISVSNGFEYFEVTMKTTKDDFNSAFPLLKEIIETPSFDKKSVEIAKTDTVNAIKSSRDNPKHVAFENFEDEMYNNSSFLKTGKILEKSVPEISRDDVKNLHSKTFAAKNMIVSIVGNIDEEDVISKFSTLLNPETFVAVSDEIIKAKLSPVKENVIKEEIKKAKGSWLVQGWQTKGLSSNDFIILKMISTYLGGGFTSKLFVDLRENKGLAYEVGASSSSNFESGMFYMYIGTNPENIEIVKNEFNKAIEKLKTKPLTESELSDLKSMMTGRLKLATETNMSKAFLNGYYEFFDKGYQFGYDYPKLIQKVTTQDILTIANKYFSQAYIMSIVAEDKYINNKDKNSEN